MSVCRTVLVNYVTVDTSLHSSAFLLGYSRMLFWVIVYSIYNDYIMTFEFQYIYLMEGLSNGILECFALKEKSPTLCVLVTLQHCAPELGRNA